MAAVEMRIQDNGTFAYLRGISDRAKKIPAKEVWNLTQFGAKAIKEEHMRRSQKFEGKIRSGIEARKVKRNQYAVFIPIQGIYLDSMKPHWVSLKRGRKISKWAKQRGIKAKSIRVKPHPFIDAGYRKMLNRLEMTANKIANKVVGG